MRRVGVGGGGGGGGGGVALLVVALVAVAFVAVAVPASAHDVYATRLMRVRRAFAAGHVRVLDDEAAAGAAAIAHERAPAADVLLPRAAARLSRLNAVALAVTPPYVSTRGSFVTVSWSGVPSPNDGDWLAVFSPAPSPANLTTVAPIKYQFCNASSTHKSSGAGSLQFFLINMRQSYAFVLFRNGIDQPVAVSFSKPVPMVDPYAPTAPHLSLTASGQVMLTWVSLAGADAVPTVLFGTAPNALTQKLAASTTTFNRTQMCGSTAATIGWRDPGHIHSAVFPPTLVPGTRYYYRFGDATGMNWVLDFVAPANANYMAPTTFIVYGDMGKAEIDGTIEHLPEAGSLNVTKYVVDSVAKGESQLVYHIGDISYALGYESQWDEFLYQIAPIASRVPYMTLIGNHERDFPGTGDRYSTANDSGGECGVSYETYFPMPTAKPDQPWYSFDFGPVHFLGISTEHAFDESSVQYAFVQRDLAAVNRTRTPWVLAAGHRPMYIDSTYDIDDNSDLVVARDLQASVEPLFLKYGVDAAFWGHHHSYQRTCKVAFNKCVGATTNGIVHWVVGTGGFDFSTNVQPTPPPVFQVVDVTNHGFARVKADRNTFTVEFVHSDDGRSVDAFTLKK